jgi:hypothetical protein
VPIPSPWFSAAGFVVVDDNVAVHGLGLAVGAAERAQVDHGRAG